MHGTTLTFDDAIQAVRDLKALTRRLSVSSNVSDESVRIFNMVLTALITYRALDTAADQRRHEPYMSDLLADARMASERN